jgi:hypothetical protein
MAGRAVVLLAALAAAAALGTAAAGPARFLPEPQTSCWDCHAAASHGRSPPVVTFASMVVPESVQAPVGAPFEYAVEVRNAWTADLTYVEPRLDLTGAPSLGFASDLPPLRLELPGNLTVDPTRLAETQEDAHALDVPAGTTSLTIRLEPDDTSPTTGPDLALHVASPGNETVVDGGGRGGAEEFNLTSAAAFAGWGSGAWTVGAEAAVLRPDPAHPFTAPRQTIPYRLTVVAASNAAADRAAGLPVRSTLKEAQGLVATFRLVASGAPGPGETVGLELLGHAHYAHKQVTRGDQDDADFSKPLGAPIAVAGDAGQVRLSSRGAAVVPPAVHNGATMATVAEAVGYATAFLFLSSTAAGGMFGKASRRAMNALFGTARRRVAFHNFLSYGLLLAASVHTALFLVEAAYAWSVGLLWGGLAVLSLLGLGATGALQVPIIRRWGYGAWRGWHYGLAVAALAFSAAHVGLDGAHFAAFQRALGWKDPVGQALA